MFYLFIYLVFISSCFSSFFSYPLYITIIFLSSTVFSPFIILLLSRIIFLFCFNSSLSLSLFLYSVSYSIFECEVLSFFNLLSRHNILSFVPNTFLKSQFLTFPVVRSYSSFILNINLLFFPYPSPGLICYNSY